MGFEGASLRSVAKEAGAPHQLATYYFKTKEELWMAVMDELATGFLDQLGNRIRGLEGVDAATKLRLVVREFVEYSAEYPQLHRLMTMEGRKESERLVWLIGRHVSRFFAISTKLIREAQTLGAVRPGDPGQLHYCAIGVATAAFSLAPEYKLVTGNDPFTCPGWGRDRRPGLRFPVYSFRKVVAEATLKICCLTSPSRWFSFLPQAVESRTCPYFRLCRDAAESLGHAPSPRASLRGS